MNRSALAAAFVLAASVISAQPAAAHPAPPSEPSQGRYRVVVDQAPHGVTAEILQGSTRPAFFVVLAPGHVLEVPGARGAPARRLVADKEPVQQSWLDDRLRPPTEPPRDPHQAGVVGRWEVPVLVNGEAGKLSGTMLWVPERTHQVKDPATTSPSHFPVVPLGMAVLTALVTVAAVVRSVQRHRTRAHRDPAKQP